MARMIKKYDKNFTVISNNVIKDETLSWKAKGIFAYLWSMPDDWDFYETEVSKHATDGRDSLRSGLKELEDKGYLTRKRARNDKGQVVSSYWQLSENPMLDNPTQDNPTQGNPTLLSTNNTNNLNKQNTNNKAPSSRSKKSKYGDNKNVLLTDDELTTLEKRFSDHEERINNLSYYLASTGKTYKSHYMTILNWARKDKKQKQNNNKLFELLDSVLEE